MFWAWRVIRWEAVVSEFAVNHGLGAVKTSHLSVRKADRDVERLRERRRAPR